MTLVRSLPVVLGHRLPPHQVNPVLGNSCRRAGWLGVSCKLEISRLICYSPSCQQALLFTTAKQERKKEKKKEQKTLAKLPYCACIQFLLCRVLIHRLKLSAASEQHAPDTL